MTLTRNLLEAATLVETTNEGKWRVRIISEGRGSSGIYSKELLEKYHTAFDGPVLSYENHPTGWDGPESRNFTQIVGKIDGPTWVDVDERGKTGVYGWYVPDPDYKERLERYRDNLGLSIYIEGDGHINEDGDFEVDSLNGQDPFRSVDVVIAAGRGGRFEESLKEMYSNRRGESNKPGVEAAPEQVEKDARMDEKAIAAVEALTAKVTELVDAQKSKAEEAAQHTADDKAVKEAVETYAAKVEAIESARESLLPSQVKHLMAEAKEGRDVAPLIESYKEMVAEAKTTLTESANAGIVVGGVTEVRYGAWS